LLTLIL
jgi:hypothetical protein